MGLKYHVNELKIRPISTEMEMPIYSNTSLSSSNKKYHSRSSETYTSIRNYHGIQPNIYENLSKLPTDILSDTSLTHSSNRTSQIFEDNNQRIYENINSSSPIYINFNHPADKPPPPPVRTTEIDIETNVLADTSKQVSLMKSLEC